jgi:hypothetical protein
MKWPSIEELNDLDMSDIVSRADSTCETSIYIDKKAGEEHYRLLKWISGQYFDKNLIEVGVYRGFSGLSLCQNCNNNVIGFDIINSIKCKVFPNYFLLIDDYKNYRFVFETSPFIFFDAAHDGKCEHEFFNWIISTKFKGLIIFDDIHLNEEMKEFWHIITRYYHHQDISHIGHHSGTGAIWI